VAIDPNTTPRSNILMNIPFISNRIEGFKPAATEPIKDPTIVPMNNAAATRIAWTAGLLGWKK
jgi:hypothetical protein